MYPCIESQDDYEQFKRDFEHGLTDLEHFSTGSLETCPDCWEEEGYGEPHFSYANCYICNRNLAGNRIVGHAWFKDEIVHLEVCMDCEYYNEYGTLDDETMEIIQSAL